MQPTLETLILQGFPAPDFPIFYLSFELIKGQNLFLKNPKLDNIK